MTGAAMSLKIIAKYISRHATGIATGLAIGSSIGAVLTAVKATREVDDILDHFNEYLENNCDDLDDEEIKDVKKERNIKIFKKYIVTILVLILSIASMIFAHKAHLKIEALAAATLAVTQTQFGEFRSAVKGRVSEREYERIENEYAVAENERLETESIHHGSEDDILDTGHGEQLFREVLTGRKFRCSYEWIEKKCIEMSGRLISELEVSYEDLFYEIAPHSYIGNAAGDYLWYSDDISRGPIEPRVEWIQYDDPVTGKIEPLGMLDFNIKPRLRTMWDR